MAKFVIECPSCGRFAEGKTGFFARKRIECVCGNVIHVKTDRLAGKQCPHCGNIVVFDQRKGEQAKCPVCRERINTLEDRMQMEDFTCAQCGVLLHVDKNLSTYSCPVCDFENNVPQRIALEKIRREGRAGVIRYEGDNETLVWKHPVENFAVGTKFVVHESQEVVFFRNGKAMGLAEAERLGTEGTVHSEIYYVNKTTQMGIKWGTDSKVGLFDPTTGMHVELGASGECSIRVEDTEKFLTKIVGTSGGFTQSQLLGAGKSKGYFRSMVMTQVKSGLAQAIREKQISVLELDERLLEISNALKTRINVYLADYGLEMPEFFVNRIVLPEEDSNFRRMKQQYADQYLLVRQEQIRKSEAEAAAARKTVEAQTQAQMKIIGAQGDAEALRIQKQAEAEAYRMKAEAEAAEMRMKGYTYQDETGRKIGLEALKNGLPSGSLTDPFRGNFESSPGGGFEGNPGGNFGGNFGGNLGEIAGLGVTLGAMSGIANMTRDSLYANAAQGMQGQPPAQSEGVRAAAQSDAWDCPACGAQKIASRFCPECGAKRPEREAAWICPNCGASGIKSRFCPECGTKRPDETWDCPDCGEKAIRSRFCPNCGRKRG